jgi:glycosyltransferase involved in cell wall biosynthesis
MVINFQNPIRPEEIIWLEKQSRGPLFFVSVSDAQRAKYDGARWSTIFNAVPTHLLQFNPGPGGYLAFLGRLTANKGIHIAVRVALATGHLLKIAGIVPDEPGSVKFFEREVKPHLGNEVEWVGEIGDEQKPAFLGGAKALLMPIQWDEPFGIVVPEALACGTPVVAMARGSMPELIRDNVNGFLVSNEEEMAVAVGRIDRISRAACRSDAEQRISADVMVDRYLSLFCTVAGSSPCR